MLRVRYAARALRDIRDIRDFIARDNVAAASSVVEAITTAIALASLFPQKSRKVRGQKMRALTLSRYPYIVFYRI